MKRAICFTFLSVLLVGCGSKMDANEKNFGAALSQYLAETGDLCLDLKKWPVDVTEMDLKMKSAIPTGSAGRMEALEAIGLVKGEEAEVEDTGLNGKPNGVKFKVKRYTKTDAAKKFERQVDFKKLTINGTSNEKGTDICYGKKALDKVVKWEGPVKFGDYQAANVTYLYKIDGLADWVKRPEFFSVFPYVGKIVSGAGNAELKHGVVLTSNGWEAGDNR